MPTVEIRCPVGPQRLLSKLRLSGQTPHYTTENLIEFSCSDCKRSYRKDGKVVNRVLHQYNFLGEFVRTVAE